MAVVTARPELPLWSDYVAFVRRHRTIVGAFMGVGLLVGFVVALGHTASYSATASVALVPVPKYVTTSATELSPPAVTIDTDAQLLHSPRVLMQVADILDTDPETASDHLSVTASPNSHALHVTVTADSARRAAEAANAAVTALVEVRRAALGALRIDQLRQVRLLIGGQQELLSQRVAIPTFDSTSAEILALSTKLDELEDARSDPVQPISEAVPPQHADRADVEVPLVSGVMIGLLCGCLAGVLRDRAASRAHRPSHAHSAPPSSDDLSDEVRHHEEFHHVV